MHLCALSEINTIVRPLEFKTAFRFIEINQLLVLFIHYTYRFGMYCYNPCYKIVPRKKFVT